MTAPIAFLDCETDGIHLDRKPWEIAIIRREPDGTETEWAAFVDIQLGDTPDGFGLKVGRFYDRHPLGRDLAGGGTSGDERGPDWVGTANAACTVARLTHGAVVVGINPSFDTHTLERLLRGHGLIPTWDYTPICAKTYAHGYLAGLGKPVPPRWKTDDLPELLGLDPVPDDERHTALGDARLAMRVYDAVMAGDGAR